MDYIQVVVGPEARQEREAVHRLLRRYPNAGLLDRGEREDELAGRLAEVYPEKARYLGEPALLGLVAKAVASKAELGLVDERSAAALSALMFAFGHTCAADPQFPWIAETLNSPIMNGTDLRAERAYAKFVNYISTGLKMTPSG